MNTVIQPAFAALPPPLSQYYPPKPPPHSSLSLSPSRPKPKTPLNFSTQSLQPLFTTPHPPNPNGSHQTHSLFSHLLHLLRLSSRHADPELARAVHASVLKLENDTHLGNALVSAYLQLGLVPDAYRVFQSLPCPNVVSFTALVSGFAKSGREEEAVELFCRMRRSGIEPNEYSFVAILTACIRILDLELGLQVHALAAKMGYLDCVFVSNAVMGLYGKCGCLDYALKVFDEMPHRDIASWNTAMASLANEFMYDEVFELFCEVLRGDGCVADYITLSTVLTACTGSNAFVEGQEVHAYAVKTGLEGNLSVGNALIELYGECGSVKDVAALFERMPVRDVITWTEMITAYMDFGLVGLAVEMFDQMPERNCFSYNALMAGFCRNGEGLRALDLFMRMVEEGMELTEFTLTSVVGACGLLMDCKTSEQIHGFVVKFGFDSNACIGAALLDMCTRCDQMGDAKKLFHQWPSEQEKSIILTSLICGYTRTGQLDEAISIFHRYQSEGIMVVDEVASTSLLGLCGTIGYHELGKQIHSHAIKYGFLADVGVGNATMSMYTKCWNMDEGIKIFSMMSTRDIVSWNVLLAGYLLHRQGDDALAVWSKMEKTGIKPDKITFILIISAHRHTNSNSVDNCRSLFLSMKAVYDIEPTSEHFASFIGVLGYWGLLDEAEDTISKMPFEPEVSVWRALLDSCRIRMNATVGKRVVKRILAMEPKDPSSYILISNLYSASGRWHCSEMVRDDMRKKGFWKHPGRSWFIHNNKIHPFYARDKSHPQAKDIYSGLEILIVECMKAGYVPDTSFVLHEVEEHQKKDFLYYHSAKLAATYGLLTNKPGKPIRVVKNILLCGDCHTFLKYLSVVAKRALHVRDASGFHYFSNGQCSCKDYW
ncbi:putative DYW domain-containing protein [Rosa chinensis]|uniref:Putative DYW domain-containing protein n=1 Tax=Rosa chinensis TaxID=74649 RepID=A0A2P6RBD3_ROSCH|nr:pentatricopeptide repeat-containing protein At5g03800 [Rosa chinensis]PRQ43733.1 putative DYW domain-containing protein [Rosa chinensis]